MGGGLNIVTGLTSCGLMTEFTSRGLIYPGNYNARGNGVYLTKLVVHASQAISKGSSQLQASGKGSSPSRALGMLS